MHFQRFLAHCCIIRLVYCHWTWKLAPNSIWRGGELLLLRKGQINRLLLSPKVRISSFFPEESVDRNWKGKIEHKGRPKERSECRLSILKETRWPILYSVSYEKFLPLVFQYEVEITSWPDNQENMQASTLKWWGKKNNSRRMCHIHGIFQKIKGRNWKNVLRILIRGYDQSWHICTYMI